MGYKPTFTYLGGPILCFAGTFPRRVRCFSHRNFSDFLSWIPAETKEAGYPRCSMVDPSQKMLVLPSSTSREAHKVIASYFRLTPMNAISSGKLIKLLLLEKWPFIVDLPMKDGVFSIVVCLPKGISHIKQSGCVRQLSYLLRSSPCTFH